MQYTKSMIDQIFLIRKIVPTPARTQVKLTNPQLLDLLADLYLEVEDLLLRDLIRQLMAMAGPAWITRLQNTQMERNPHQQVYRGHAVTATTPTTQTPKPAAPKEKTVMYRGHPVVAPN